MLKCIPVPRSDTDAHKCILKEVAIHRAVSLGSDPKEDGILPLMSHFITPSIFGTHRRPSNVEEYVVLVLPYCAKGSLSDFVIARLARGKSAFVLEENELRWTITELAKALQRCHERGIIHGNVKAENILLWQSSSTLASSPKQGDGPIRLVSTLSLWVPVDHVTELRVFSILSQLLCDFGTSTWMDEKEAEANVDEDNTLCGDGEQSRSSADIVALGHLCVFLLSGSTLSMHSADDDSSSNLSDVRVDETPAKKTPLDEMRARLPPGIGYHCRNLIEELLNNVSYFHSPWYGNDSHLIPAGL